jgi:hypothetical protein
MAHYSRAGMPNRTSAAKTISQPAMPLRPYLSALPPLPPLSHSASPFLPPAQQELVRPDVFWYTSAVDVELPFDVTGLVAFELFVMHWVESRRGYDVKNPGSMDQDPIFSNFKLPKHDVSAHTKRLGS